MNQIKCPECKTKMSKDGKIWKCKACLKTITRQEVDSYSRVVGYYSPIKSTNEGKAQEIADRKMFKVNE